MRLSFSYEDRRVSKYVMDFLQIRAGEQIRLMAATNLTGWNTVDKVLFVARGVKEFAGVRMFVQTSNSVLMKLIRLCTLLWTMMIQPKSMVISVMLSVRRL